METGLWIAQGVLAAVFVMAGSMKLMRTKSELHDKMEWVEDFSEGSIRIIGVAELLGAVGLILPGVMDVAPVLVPVAASGLAISQAVAAVVHIRRSEVQMVVMNVMLIAVAVFIAWGRFGDYAF